MQDRRKWILIPGTESVRLVVDGEVVHECESFECSDPSDFSGE